MRYLVFVTLVSLGLMFTHEGYACPPLSNGRSKLISVIISPVYAFTQWIIASAIGTSVSEQVPNNENVPPVFGYKPQEDSNVLPLSVQQDFLYQRYEQLVNEYGEHRIKTEQLVNEHEDAIAGLKFQVRLFKNKLANAYKAITLFDGMNEKRQAVDLAGLIGNLQQRIETEREARLAAHREVCHLKQERQTLIAQLDRYRAIKKH